MRLLLIHRDDVYDRKTWSGIPDAVRRGLEGQGVQVDVCDKLGWPKSIGIALQNRVYALFGAGTYYRMGVSRYYRHLIEQRLKGRAEPWDGVLVVNSFEVMPFLESAAPVVYISDCTKVQLLEFKYPGFDRFSPMARRQLLNQEQRAYRRASCLAFSSRWAADSAVQIYQVPNDKVRAIPLGANIDHLPPTAEACTCGAWRNAEGCELLFLGVDWKRKGGDLAVRTVRKLNEMGLKSRLTICGVQPKIDGDDQIRIIPFLDKQKPDDMLRLERLLGESSFLLLPTQAECFGLVFCEAFAYGLPPIACRVGAVPEIITHGHNGFVLDRQADPAEYARVIHDCFTHPPSYLALRRSARHSYESVFNWGSWAREIRALFESLNAPRRRESKAAPAPPTVA